MNIINQTVLSYTTKKNCKKYPPQVRAPDSETTASFCGQSRQSISTAIIDWSSRVIVAAVRS